MFCSVFAAFALAGEPSLQFEVASVKPAGTSVEDGVVGVVIGGPGSSDPTLMRFVRNTMVQLIGRAFHVEADQISGPGWMWTERYNIDARAPLGTTKEQVNEMLHALLRERFQMVVHREPRSLRGYELVLAARRVGLTPSREPDARPMSPQSAMQPPDADGYPRFPDGYGGLASRVTGGISRWTAKSVSIESLCRTLAVKVGFEDGGHSMVRIIDKTGLTGKFDFRLWYSLTSQESAKPDDSEGSSRFFTVPALRAALEKQLGLKLNSAKFPLDTIVVDAIRRLPTEN